MRAFSVPQNLVLRAAAVRADGLPHTVFAAGERFWKEGAELRHALFPVRGVVSLQVSAPPHRQVQVAMVGREGFAGASLFFGDTKARETAVALTDGEAVLVPLARFEACLRKAAFRRAAGAYVRTLLLMLQRTAACTRVHLLEQVCVANLLLVQDRTRDGFVPLTQEMFSRLLAVRRASISRALAALQSQGVVEHDRRGRLSIPSRSALESCACSCYRAVKTEFDRFVKAHGGL